MKWNWPKSTLKEWETINQIKVIVFTKISMGFVFLIL